MYTEAFQCCKSESLSQTSCRYKSSQAKVEQFTNQNLFKMKFVASFAVFVLLSLEEATGQTDLGPGITVYKLKVVEDVTLERGSTNFNYLQYLIVGFLPGYPKKRSLLRFEDVPTECKSVNHAMMYIYYVYSHKASFYTVDQAPFITRTIQAHRVLKSWKESQATSTRRDSYNNWHTPWLGLNNTDATCYLTGRSTVYANRASGFVEIEVTSAVKDWKSGSPNYGVVIWATNENKAGRGTRFASNADSDSSRHAYIILNCNNDVRNKCS